MLSNLRLLSHTLNIFSARSAQIFCDRSNPIGENIGCGIKYVKGVKEI